MSATEDWLRYIENRAIMQEYGIKGYSNSESEEDSEENKQEDSK